MIGTTGRFNDISTSPYDWWHRSSKMVTVSGSEDWDLEPVTTTLALVIPGLVPVLSASNHRGPLLHKKYLLVEKLRDGRPMTSRKNKQHLSTNSEAGCWTSIGDKTRGGREASVYGRRHSD